MSVDFAIVIPVGPGDHAWVGLLPQLADAGAARIVLALAAGDDSASGAGWPQAMVIHGAPGRAQQLNAGAAACDARWLWFLHADSRVEPATLTAARRFIEADTDAIGYFSLYFLDDGPRWVRLNALGARLRSRWFGLPFGDQGFLMPRRVFTALGGFDETLASGEDHALVWTAHAAGVPLRALSAPIRTSARKYAQHGWWTTTLGHLRLTLRQARDCSRRAGR